MNSSDDYSYDEDSEGEAVRWKRTENRYGKPAGTKKPARVRVRAWNHIRDGYEFFNMYDFILAGAGLV